MTELTFALLTLGLLGWGLIDVYGDELFDTLFESLPMLAVLAFVALLLALFR
jgi:uncharacterized membrane protein YuzA (DUF378 family)